MYVYNLYNFKKINIQEYKGITLRNQVYDRNQVDDKSVSMYLFMCLLITLPFLWRFNIEREKELKKKQIVIHKK